MKEAERRLSKDYYGLSQVSRENLEQNYFDRLLARLKKLGSFASRENVIAEEIEPSLTPVADFAAYQERRWRNGRQR